MNSTAKFSQWAGIAGWKLTPYQTVVLAFAGLILLGALLLMTPPASVNGKSLNFMDALFTATSAVCVTGLVVVDTGTYFTPLGQMVILALIQIGGLGVMTVTTLLAVATGKKIQLRERLVMQEAMNQMELSGVVRITLYIVKATLCIEFLGGTVLAGRLYQDYGLKGIYMGYWQAVSSFCNAGFDLFGGFRSITAYVADPTVSLTVAALLIIGGIGFTVIADVWNYRRAKRLSLHSKIVIAASAALLLLGTIVVLAAEYSNPATLAKLPLSVKLMASFFQAATARTAGLNSIDTGSLREGTLFFVIILMFIGASPGSTGGGIKTTTAAALLCSLVSTVTGKTNLPVFRRQIPQQTANKAFTVFLMSALLVVTVTMVLTFTENAPLLKLLFEVTSAFGTVGLSTGITPALSPAGKAALIATMFAGRVGSLTLIMALALQKRNGTVQYPTAKVMIG